MECPSVVRRHAIALAALGLALGMPTAQAHPHMWIDARAALVFDESGALSAIKQRWLFDDMFSPYAMQGVERDKAGKYPRAALQAMADDWMGALGDPVSHYFTRVTVGDKVVGFGAPQAASVVFDNTLKRLALSFTLPLEKPVPMTGPVRVDIYDPTYFVAYAFDEKGAVTLSGAPAECRVTYLPPKALDYETMQQLAAIPQDADPAALPEELFAITKGLTHRIEASCP